MFRVASWNVLHRVHGLNWGEPAIAAFPEERPRQEGIVARVRALLEEGVQAVGLQEVSGDLLGALREGLGGSVCVLGHRAPRLPRLRQEGPPGLDDASEYVAIVTVDPAATPGPASAFESDRGKGFFSVDLVGGTRFLSTHISFGPRAGDQIAQLLTAHPSVVVGDFNAPAGGVAAALGGAWTLADLSHQGPTRVAASGNPGKVIDHIAVHRGRVLEARVLDARGLSDHHPIVALIEPG